METKESPGLSGESWNSDGARTDRPGEPLNSRRRLGQRLAGRPRSMTTTEQPHQKGNPGLFALVPDIQCPRLASSLLGSLWVTALLGSAPCSWCSAWTHGEGCGGLRTKAVLPLNSWECEAVISSTALTSYMVPTSAKLTQAPSLPAGVDGWTLDENQQGRIYLWTPHLLVQILLHCFSQDLGPTLIPPLRSPGWPCPL